MTFPITKEKVIKKEEAKKENISSNNIPAGTKILVVEDDKTCQMVIKAQLKALGIEVTIVTNGQEALEKLEQEDYAIILTDVVMKVMDGHELARRIRKQGKNIPIIGTTGNADSASKDECLDAGMNDVLPKPYRPKALYDKIYKYLDM